jgi:hypothetical protein
MTPNKTVPRDDDVDAFLAAIPDEARRAECRTVASLMHQITGVEPRMWGAGMVGFGTYRYRYDSGREGEWFLTGFAPRKKELTVYVLPGLEGFGEILARLGRHRTGKSCLYLRSLDDVDAGVLEELIRAGVEAMGEQRVE